MSIFLEDTNIISINEVYFGKSKLLQEAENILDQFRNKYYGKKHLNDNQTDPLLDKYNKIMAEIFGFKLFYLRIIPSLSVNAYTYGQSISINAHNQKIISTKEGFKYNGNIISIIFIYSGLIFDPYFTTPEIMAIILHEVGHNFSNKKSILIDITGMWNRILLIFVLLIGCSGVNNIQGMLQGMDTGREIYKEYVRIQQENESIAYLINFFHFIYNLPIDILSIGVSAIPSIIFVPFAMINSLIYFIKSPLRFITHAIDERIADNFCTMYGYGAELSSGLEKLPRANPVQKLIHNDTVPIIGWTYDFLAIPGNWLLNIFDEHPTTPSRRKDQYNYLISELKKNGNTDKKLAKEIEAELDRMEKVMSIMEENCKQYRGTAVQDKYNLLVNKLSRGDDIRSYFQRNSDRNLNDWDDMYDKGLKEHTISSIKNIDLI